MVLGSAPPVGRRRAGPGAGRRRAGAPRHRRRLRGAGRRVAALVAIMVLGGPFLLSGVAASFTGSVANPASAWSAAANFQTGTLSTFGDGSGGQLGLGPAADTNVATPVGTNSAWLMVGGGWEGTCGIRRDGTLWCWGKGNLVGQGWD